MTEVNLVDDMFGDDTTKPESNWMKWEKIGDSVAGTLVMPAFEKEGNFGTQTVFVLQTADGMEINVALKNASQKRQIQSLHGAEVGDMLAFRYSGDYDSGKGNPGKNIDVRIRKAA